MIIKCIETGHLVNVDTESFKKYQIKRADRYELIEGTKNEKKLFEESVKHLKVQNSTQEDKHILLTA